MKRHICIFPLSCNLFSVKCTDLKHSWWNLVNVYTHVTTTMIRIGSISIIPESFLVLPLVISSSHPKASTLLISITKTGFVRSGFSRKQNHAVCPHFCLAALTPHNDFEVHPCGYMYQQFNPFYSWVIFHCIHVPQSTHNGWTWRFWGYCK